MFEKASRLHLRFETRVGGLSTEDLWDLPLTSNTGKVHLDEIAKDLHKKLKNEDEVSFVEQKVETENLDTLRFEIVKHIIGVRINESKARSEAVERRNEKQRLLELLSKKKDESLNDLTIAELEERIKTFA